MHQPVGVFAHGGRCTSQSRSVVFQTRNVEASVGVTVLSFAERENRFLGIASTDAKENAFSKESHVTVYVRCLPRGRLLAQF